MHFLFNILPFFLYRAKQTLTKLKDLNISRRKDPNLSMHVILILIVEKSSLIYEIPINRAEIGNSFLITNYENANWIKITHKKVYFLWNFYLSTCNASFLRSLSYFSFALLVFLSEWYIIGTFFSVEGICRLKFFLSSETFFGISYLSARWNTSNFINSKNLFLYYYGGIAEIPFASYMQPFKKY